MIKISKNIQPEAGKIKIRKGKSGLSEFVNHPLPTDDEIEEFEEAVEEEARENEIDESLSEIYKDEQGNAVDVGKLNIKKKQGFFFWFLKLVFSLAVVGGLGYGVYYYIFLGGSDSTALEFSISGPEKVIAGEEFFCTVDYKNSSNANIKNVRIELVYPENFIFLDSLPVADEKNSVWQISEVMARASGIIKIKGKIVNGKDSINVLAGKVLYTPDNFSSEFKKEASKTFTIEDTGVVLEFDYSSAVLVGEENEIIIKVKGQENNFFPQFKLTVDPAENLDIISAALAGEKPKDNSGLVVEKILPGSWNISGLKEENQELKIKYKLSKKMSDTQDIILRFENSAEDDKSYTFLEKRLNVEVMKSDLNLTLIINGSKSDQAIKFGDKLNYSLVYVNKGETSMKDVIIMAILDSGFLDRSTLNDENNGREKGNSIVWTKEEIPGLEELKPDEEGVIDFSLSLVPFEDKYLNYSVNEFQVKSYAQFSVGGGEVSSEKEGNIDNKSNTIINKINSDLSLKEEVRYFSEDNLPVGNGPLPPKIGQETSFKIYWTLTNNLHELQNTKVEIFLPSYVSWNDKNRTSVGTISYDGSNHKVIWDIGRLPVTVYRADAEFNISITPQDSDKNKIMVLSPGSKASAIDAETQGVVESTTRAKTTKLEDDEIAGMSSDGRVE
jgi:hypothetical protein